MQLKNIRLLLNDPKWRSTNLFVDEKAEIRSNLRQGPFKTVINHEVMYLTEHAEGKLRYSSYIFHILYHILFFRDFSYLNYTTTNNNKYTAVRTIWVHGIYRFERLILDPTLNRVSWVRRTLQYTC